ncbi:MAG: lipoyl(octanoyl) transferase LipB [Bacteroidia bacterium]|nr:lipoyl(octanoyl) transferase LipB [Bacteroidia bacterium]
MPATRQPVGFQDMGRIPYQPAWDLQERLLASNVALKLAGRAAETRHWLLFCEHDPVYTLGKSGKPEHLLLDEAARVAKGIEYYKINRGGDITYHGPGQITGYPIWDLEKFRTDIGWYLRTMEEVMISLLADYGLTGGRIAGATGVWLGTDTPDPRKICAMGVRCSRWVTMHGFAFNVNTELAYFNHIVPCGIDDKGVTSLAAELGHAVPQQEVQDKLLHHLAAHFELDITPADVSVA